jgi:dTDP-4-dehydrorhamnose reductase
MKKEKMLITGANGALGLNLVSQFCREYEVYGTDLHASSLNKDLRYLDGDLTDLVFIEKLLRVVNPQVIINTVALVDLDLCEEDKNLANRINVQTAENVAGFAHQCGARMVHISTDHFFDGKKSYYKEDDAPAPVNNYGSTKLEAERVCMVRHDNLVLVRTNFYGWSHPKHKPTFGEWMYESLAQGKPIKLFTDYYFTPIEVTALAEALAFVLKSDFRGVINVAGLERCSKYDFGIAMAKVFGLNKNSIVPAKMEPGAFKVKRQSDLSLSVEKFSQRFGMKLPNLIEGLKRFKATLPLEHRHA